MVRVAGQEQLSIGSRGWVLMSESGSDAGKQKQIHYTCPALQKEFTIELAAAFLSFEYVCVL